MHLKVENNPDLIRDNNSKAILNNNDTELLIYKQKREERRKLFRLQEEHEQLKNDVTEIKNLLRSLLEKHN